MRSVTVTQTGPSQFVIEEAQPTVDYPHGMILMVEDAEDAPVQIGSAVIGQFQVQPPPGTAKE